VVSGRITGCIVVRKKIEIAASAIIRGRVIASSIAMARGATIDGEVTVTGNQPIVEFEERRASAVTAAATVIAKPVTATATAAIAAATQTR
jgi:cytoskeletal protein CcmA (bactofilin family)